MLVVCDDTGIRGDDLHNKDEDEEHGEREELEVKGAYLGCTISSERIERPIHQWSGRRDDISLSCQGR